MSNFKVSMSGKTATVLRSFKFPKTDPLPELSLSLNYEVKLSLAGIDEKSPAAKNILAGFAKAYEAALSKAVKPRAAKNLDIWNKAAKLLQKGEDPKKVTLNTKRQLTANWNEFDTKIAKPLVNDVLDQLVLDELGKLDGKKVKSSATFKSEDLKEDRLKVLTGLAGVAGGAVATAAASAAALAVIPVLATVAAIVGTMAATRKLSEKTYSDMETTRKRIDKDLDAATKILSKLEPQIKTLEQQKQKLGLLMVKNEANLRKAHGEIGKLKAGDIKELNAEKKIKDLNARFDNAQKSLIEERKKRAGILLDLKNVQDLVAKAKTVSDEFVAARSWYDKSLAAFDGSSTEIGAANTVLGSLGKLLKSFS